MTTPLGEPRDSLRLDNPFTGVPHLAPPREVLTVGLIVSLPARRQLLPTVRPLIRAGEVGDEGLVEVDLALYAVLRQVIQPYTGRTL